MSYAGEETTNRGAPPTSVADRPSDPGVFVLAAAAGGGLFPAFVVPDLRSRHLLWFIVVKRRTPGFRSQLIDGRVVQPTLQAIARPVTHGTQLNSNIYLYDINLLKSKKLNHDLKKNKIKSFVLNKNNLIEQFNNIDLVCNCSSSGHYKNPGNPLNDIKNFKNDAIFFDAIYTPLDTKFLSQAKRQKYKTISGLELFIYQGIESFLIFTKRYELREKLMISSGQFISKYQNLFKENLS